MIRPIRPDHARPNAIGFQGNVLKGFAFSLASDNICRLSRHSETTSVQYSRSDSLSLLGAFGNVALQQGDDLGEIIGSAVTCVAKGLEVSKAAILLPRPNAILVAEAWVGWDDHVMRGRALDENGQDPCALAFRSEPATRRFDRDHRGGFWPEIHVAGGISSVIGASIRFGERRYGVVEACAETSGHFDSGDCEFLATLANLLAAAFLRLGHSPLKGRSGAAAPRGPAVPGQAHDPVAIADALAGELPVDFAPRDIQGTISNSTVYYRHCASAQVLSDCRSGISHASEIGGGPATGDSSLMHPDGNAVRVKLEEFSVRGFDDDQRVGSSGVAADSAMSRSAQPMPLSLDLPHRVRNILSVIRVIARRTAERSESIEDYAAQLDSRISAIARVQTGMLTDPQAGVDLEALIFDELLAHSIKGEQVKAKGPRVKLWAKAADTLGLAIHELIENAIKYGALSAKSGRVDITWRIDQEPDRFEFDWCEFGVSILSRTPRRRGFGHELIERTLPYELAASTSIEFRPGGIRCRVAIPLESRAAAPSRFIRGYPT